MQKILPIVSLVSLLLVIAIPESIFAQGASSDRITIQEKREEMQEVRTQRLEQMTERRDELQQKRSELHEQVQEKREAVHVQRQQQLASFQQQLTQIRDDRKRMAAERINTKMTTLNTTYTDRLSSAIDRMTEILSELKEQESLLEGDTEAVAVAIAQAEDGIASATAAITIQAGKVYVLTITDEENLRSDVGGTVSVFRSDLKTTHQTVVGAKQAVMAAASAYAQIKQEISVTEETIIEE